MLRPTLSRALGASQLRGVPQALYSRAWFATKEDNPANLMGSAGGGSRGGGGAMTHNTEAAATGAPGADADTADKFPNMPGPGDQHEGLKTAGRKGQEGAPDSSLGEEISKRTGGERSIPTYTSTPGSEGAEPKPSPV